jgi:hypothetical protein
MVICKAFESNLRSEVDRTMSGSLHAHVLVLFPRAIGGKNLRVSGWPVAAG